MLRNAGPLTRAGITAAAAIAFSAGLIAATAPAAAQPSAKADSRVMAHPRGTTGGAKTANAVITGQLRYGGGVSGVGVTSGSPKVYVVFYGSQWGTVGTDANGYTTLSGDPKGMAPRLQAMYKGLGTNSELWSGTFTQYCEGAAKGATTCAAGLPKQKYPSSTVLAGVWVDESVASPANATAFQLGTETNNAAAHFGNLTAAANRNVQYIIVSPPGTHPDGFNTPAGGFCAWHDYTGDAYVGVTSPYGLIAFTNAPYVTDMGASCGQNYVNAGAAGTLDGVTMVMGHEYGETVTDQFPAGGWTDRSGWENADKCSWIGVGGTGGSQNITFATGTFAMQGSWSNDSKNCRITHAIVL